VDGDGHARGRGSAARCDRAITNGGGVAEVALRVGGHAHGGAGSDECGRSFFDHRGDGANIRICTIRPFDRRRGCPRGGGTDRGVSATRGQCGLILGSGPCEQRPTCVGGARPPVGRPTKPGGDALHLDDATEGKDWDRVETGVGLAAHALNMALGALHDVVDPIDQVRPVRAFVLDFSFFGASNLCCSQSLMSHSHEKSQFLHQ
jgi:hypothetical protein